mmetsp:Transcript_15650/g.28451  ORF Transcript_15650/g.28451 Transcript_15650/m.28451 type:complete len:158 (+) Transcript_15650:1051-1524(+)
MYKMYNEIYAEMTEAGVAVELEEPIWVDKDGNEVNQQSQAVGRKITHRIIHPDYTLHADEVGGDTSQKGDGHVGGVKFLTAPDTIPTTGTADNDNHFTTMCFTAGNGKHVNSEGRRYPAWYAGAKREASRLKFSLTAFGRWTSLSYSRGLTGSGHSL